MANQGTWTYKWTSDINPKNPNDTTAIRNYLNENLYSNDPSTVKFVVPEFAAETNYVHKKDHYGEGIFTFPALVYYTGSDIPDYSTLTSPVTWTEFMVMGGIDNLKAYLNDKLSLEQALFSQISCQLIGETKFFDNDNPSVGLEMNFYVFYPTSMS